ncbi:YciI family protein [Anatilimnocola floriformis]|uniref:YciI family protein n=1 Tax=Anatilimnocola floriformis TaxID=2948575 RepID=UPI0020C1ECD9|nr:YciI family protein [Anatilimnocola floriformis]
MKYMLLCYHEEKSFAEIGQDAIDRAIQESVESMQKLHAKGQYILSSPLPPVSAATSVRVREGQQFVTDGPFAETREVLGGFYLIDVDNLDEAIAVAAQQPGARFGTIEIRPLLEISNLPNTKPCGQSGAANCHLFLVRTA